MKTGGIVRSDSGAIGIVAAIRDGWIWVSWRTSAGDRAPAAPWHRVSVQTQAERYLVLQKIEADARVNLALDPEAYWQ